MIHLEDKEWTNLWWEEAQDYSKPRVLLIGDSITVGYQPIVNKYLNGKIYANMYATSKAVDHPMFIEELEFVWKQNGYKYDLVHFNNGLHGWHLKKEEYAKEYEEIVIHILKNHPEVKLIVALTTPCSINNDIMHLDQEKDQLIRERNEAVIDIGKRFGLEVNDMYGAMIDHPEYHVQDGCHFNDQGIEVQGAIVKSVIQKNSK